MEECSFVEEIKTEPSPIEDTEIEKSADEVKDCLKIESLLDNEQTWSKDLHPVDLQLTNEEVSIKTEVEEYDEKPHCVLLKKEIEDPVDSAIAGPSNCGKSYIDADCSIKQESDYDINEEFEIKNDADVEGENSEQSCSDDVEASKQDGCHLLENGDFDGENCYDSNKSIITIEQNQSGGWKRKSRSQLETKKLEQNTAIPKIEMKCNLCKFSTTTKSLLDYHFRRIHCNLERYECPGCYYRTMLKIRVIRHIIVDHIDKREQRNYLKEFNIEIIKNGSKYSKSNLNKFSTKRKWNVRDHVQFGKKQFEFSFCGSATARKKSLQNHFRIEHHVKDVNMKITSKPSNNFKCDSCDFSAKTEANLKNHIECVHLKSRKYECTHCDYRTSHKSKLKIHIDVIHLRKKQFKCNDCDFATAWRGSLRRHIYTEHPNEETRKLEKKFKCDLCDYLTRRKSHLTKHINGVHLKLRNFKCYHCDFGAPDKWRLKTHIDCVHFSTNQFKCNHCSYHTTWKHCLQSHSLRYHSDKITS